MQGYCRTDSSKKTRKRIKDKSLFFSYLFLLCRIKYSEYATTNIKTGKCSKKPQPDGCVENEKLQKSHKRIT